MKVKKGFIALLVVVMVACACFLTSCAGSSEEAEETEKETVSTESQGTQEETLSDEITEIQMAGEISYIGDTYISIRTFEVDTSITDFTLIDKDSLQAGDNYESLEISELTQYSIYDGSQFISATREELAMGEFIVSAYENGIHTIIIYPDYPDEAENADSEAEDGSDAEAEAGEYETVVSDDTYLSTDEGDAEVSDETSEESTE